MSCIYAPSPTEPRGTAQRALAPLAVDQVAARSELDLLLDRARRLGANGPGWTSLTNDAARQTRQLAAHGAVPAHLVVDPTDPPVVVERSLLALTRHLDRLYPGPVTGRSAWESSGTADA